MMPDQSSFVSLTNGRAIPLESVPMLSLDDFGGAVLDGVAGGQRVAAMFGISTGRAQVAQLYAVLADDEQNRLYAGRAEVEGDRFPSLTPRCPQVHLFEREIAEQFGLRAVDPRIR